MWCTSDQSLELFYVQSKELIDFVMTAFFEQFDLLVFMFLLWWESLSGMEAAVDERTSRGVSFLCVFVIV